MAVAEAAAAIDGADLRKVRTDRNGLEVLDRSTCLALVGRVSVGRVA